MVWGCFSSSGIEELHVIKETMNQQKYCDRLEKCFCSSARTLRLGRHWTFQQDNDPKHTSRQTEWPIESTDVNPIENLWKQLKVKVGERRPSNLKEFKEVCTEEWGKSPADVCHNLGVILQETIGSSSGHQRKCY